MPEDPWENSWDRSVLEERVRRVVEWLSRIQREPEGRLPSSLRRPGTSVVLRASNRPPR